MKDSFKEIENIGGKKIQKESKEDRELRIAENYKKYNHKIREEDTLKELSLDQFQHNFVEAYSAVTKNSWNKDSRARGAILQLAEWFSGHITKQNLSEDKGIFLYGDFGTGKSSIMKAFNLMSTTKKFKIKSLKTFMLISPFFAFFSFKLSLNMTIIDNFLIKIFPGNLLFLKLKKL